MDVTFPYTHHCTLRNGHTESVTCMAFSPLGEILASGGDDCFVIIWDVALRAQLYRIVTPNPVLCLCWDPRSPFALFVGCDQGVAFHISDYRTGMDTAHQVLTVIEGPVYSLAYDVTTDFLAIAIGSEVQLAREFISNGNYRVYATFGLFPKPPIPPYIPEEQREKLKVRARSLHYMHNGTKLVVSYLFHGVVCWDTGTITRLWRTVPSGASRLIGSSALSPDGLSMIVTNLQDGVDLYPVGQSQITQRYRYTPDPSNNVPVSVAFLHGSQHVTCGSNYGEVCIWDTETGQNCQTLLHAGDIARSVAGYAYLDHSMVAVGTSKPGDQTYIRLWKASIHRHLETIGFDEPPTAASAEQLRSRVASTWDRFSSAFRTHRVTIMKVLVVLAFAIVTALTYTWCFSLCKLILDAVLMFLGCLKAPANDAWIYFAAAIANVGGWLLSMALSFLRGTQKFLEVYQDRLALPEVVAAT